MKIALFGRELDLNHINTIQEVVLKLNKENVKTYIYEPFYLYLKTHHVVIQDVYYFKTAKDLRDIDYLFSFGGDGTLLASTSFAVPNNIPILGINMGRLGFLSSISAEAINEAINEVSTRNFNIDERNILSVSSSDKNEVKNHVINEVTVYKETNTSMILIHTYVNDVFLNSYWADGLIISTPTGSTAYSLSCNGPIVMPGSKNIIIVPIAPHNLNVRPLVISDDSEIKLKIESREPSYLLALDGKTSSKQLSTELTIKKATSSLQLIQLKNHNYFSMLRKKLMWGADIRN